ncbi:hypothetical protein [Hyalangium versicolor]|uniref:hypothetical protein n=1 Tax=Hyalangium versicolor TaxID=2861190 RepID=UPI001CCF8E57|nr:hypothetical protein [Hyalangium versicolor]
MRRALMRARWLVLLVPLVAASCKDDPPPEENPPPGDDKPTACLDQPTALATPPKGELPCELLPPGFAR